MSSEDSWNRMDRTECEQPESHRLCANGCGFFGTAATMNLCSKCYRDFLKKEEQEASAKVAVEKSLNPKSNPSTTTIQQQQQQSISTTCVEFDSSSTSTTSKSATVESDPSVKNRCKCCNKRVRLMGYECRCGSTFCSTHRYPEFHDCTFDFKEMGRNAIAKANPVVKSARNWDGFS